jgi:MoxR-like ATPase
VNEENNMESDRFRETFFRLVDEIKKVIVGNDAIIARILIAFYTGGHVLLEGVPGLGKTLLVKSMSQALGLSFKRVQFTPDLMPSDIIGTQVLTENNGTREFQFKRGPIFAQVVLADEINRATPKTQSAVLEAMEERQVTVFGETHVLESPFMVLATQNPIELEGTYPLPEAQLDRFFFKLVVEAPSVPELREILNRTTGVDTNVVAQVLSADDTALLQDMRKLVRGVLIAPPIEEYVVQLIHKTQPRGSKDPASISAVEEYLRFGASPRGAQAVILGAKGHALTRGRVHVSYEDIDAVVFPALRHRLILNFQAEAENVTADDVLKSIIQQVPRA